MAPPDRSSINRLMSYPCRCRSSSSARINTSVLPRFSSRSSNVVPICGVTIYQGRRRPQDRYWPAPRGPASGPRLALPHRRDPRVLDVVRRFVGDLPAAQPLDHVEGHVEACRHAGRRDDSIGHDPRGPIDLNRWIERGEQIERGPMRCRTATGEQSCLRQEQGAGADRCDQRGAVRRRPQPSERRLVAEQGARAKAARYDEDVDRRRISPGVGWRDLQPADRGDDVVASRDGEDIERRAGVAPTRFRTGEEPRPRKHFERPREVEHLDVIEDQDADVLFVHPIAGLFRYARPKRSAARARAAAATCSRSRGAAVVCSESINRRATCATSSMARSNAASFAFDGALNPLSLRTNCSDAALISSSVAGGSKLNSVLMLRHMMLSLYPFTLANEST